MLFGTFVLFCFADFCFLSRAERHVIRQTYFAYLADFYFSFMAYRHSIRHIYFLLLREFILTHTLHRRTVCCFCTLNVSCFRKSLVVHALRARPRLPSCKRLRSKECPRRRIKWRYATAGQQETAKQTMSNVQNENGDTPPPESQQFAKRVMSNAQNENSVLPHPNNNRLFSFFHKTHNRASCPHLSLTCDLKKQCHTKACFTQQYETKLPYDSFI